MSSRSEWSDGSEGYGASSPGLSAKPSGQATHTRRWKTPGINDLRSAIDHIRKFKGQYIETNHPVDPHAELAGVYRYIGAGGTVMRPTRTGPAMMFNNIKGFPNSRVLVGMMASRERVS